MPLQVIGDSFATSGITLSRFSADGNGSHIHLVKSRNATKGSQTVVQVDDTLGFIGFYGSDGTDTLNRSASVNAICDYWFCSNSFWNPSWFNIFAFITSIWINGFFDFWFFCSSLCFKVF